MNISIAKNSVSLLSKSKPSSIRKFSNNTSSSSFANGASSSSRSNNNDSVDIKTTNGNSTSINNSNNHQNGKQVGRINNNENWNNGRDRLRHRRDWDGWNNWGLSPFQSFWDPFQRADRFHRHLSDLFDERGSKLTVPSSNEIFDWSPTADMITTKDGYEITAELPGVTKENIKIEVNDDIITLTGEKKSEVSREEKSGSHYKERSFGSFVRKFSLPEGVDPKLVKAEFKDGVLRMHLPKGSKPEAHTIKVE